MKRNTAFFAAAIMAICMTSCGSTENIQLQTEENSSPDLTEAAVTETYAEITEAETEALFETSAETLPETQATFNAVKGENRIEVDNTPEKANKYGYYPANETTETGVSIAALDGEWTDGTSVLTFSDGETFSGKFACTAGEQITEGTVALEYSLNPDYSKEYWYNLYKSDGSFYMGFGVSGVIPLEDLYAGQSGIPHYTRVREITAEDYTGVWGCGKATLTITAANSGTYDIYVKAASSAAESTQWEYKGCTFDETTGEINCNGTGICNNIVFDEDGTYTSELRFSGASASFRIDAGTLKWNDMEENSGEDMSFVKS